MGFSAQFYETGPSLERVEGNKKVLFCLHEGFLELEKDLESAGIGISNDGGPLLKSGPLVAPTKRFREMAIIRVEVSVGALLINLLKSATPKEVSRFIPIPMAMVVPFYIGAYFAIGMFVGTVILYVWESVNLRDAEDYAGAIASGLTCGDGIWTVPSAVLSIFKINPPMCMYFGLPVSS